MINWLIFFVVIGWVITNRHLLRHRPCKCRRECVYFTRIHQRAWQMVVDGVMCTALAAQNLIFYHDVGSRIWVVILVFCAALSFVRFWYHEKDKIKKAAKALGRVVVNEHGCLAVVKDT